MQNSSSIASVSSARLRAPTLLVALTLGLGVFVGAPRSASAEKTVVVLDFSGRGAKKVQKQVIAILKKEHTVITSRRYTRAAKKLRAKKPTDENVAKVLQELEADGMILGTLKKKRGRVYRVKIRFRTAATGEFGEEFTVLTRGRTLSAKAKKVVKKKLLAAVDELPPVQEEEPEEPEEPEDEGDDDDDEEDIIADASDDDDDDEDVEVEKKKKKGDDDVELSDEEKADLMVRGRAVDMAAGLSFIGRSLSFTVEDGLGDLAPRGYDGALVAGAFFSGELYPMAFNLKNKSFTRNIGVTAVVDKVLKIESRLVYRDAANQTQELTLPSAQMRWGFGLVYRHNFGKKPTSPTVKLGVRYSSLSFTIDRSEADTAGVPVDIPDITYSYIDPGLSIRFPVGATLALLADARFLMITGTGTMQETSEYGAATVTGIDGDFGIEYAVNKKLSVRAGGRYTKIGFDFDGTGDKTHNRDGDPEQDVFGASDQYIGGYVTAGYRL